jgi:hypothetical protein
MTLPMREQLVFNGVVFRKRLFITGINSASTRGGSVKFARTQVVGYADMSHASLDALTIDGRWSTDSSAIEDSQSGEFDGGLSLRGLKANLLNIDSTSFGGKLDLSDSVIGTVLSVRDSTFKSELSFARARLPKASHGHITFDGTAFGTVTDISEDQIGDRLLVHDGASYLKLADVLEKTKDLYASSEYRYLFRVSDADRRCDGSPGCKLEDRIDRLAWGYGYKPLRPAVLLAAVWAVGALIYFSQARQLGVVKGLRFAAAFSWRTSTNPRFGYANAMNIRFRAVTLCQSALSILFALMLLKTLGEISPLLHDLLNKIIPI